MTWSIAVVCEARADRDTAACLADRVILDSFGEAKGGWIAEQLIDDFRTYRGLHPGDEFVAWKRIDELAKEKAIKPRRGQFSGYYPSHEDELDILRAFQLLLFHSSRPPDGIIFLRDTDNEEERRKGLEAARSEVPRTANVPVVVGIAHTKRECWHIAGFEPDPVDEGRRAVEDGRLESFHKSDDLGFDPRLHSEELWAKHDHDKRSPKRVLKELTAADRDREYQCLIALPLDELARRGQKNGLADFIADLKQHLLRLFGHTPPG